MAAVLDGLQLGPVVHCLDLYRRRYRYLCHLRRSLRLVLVGILSTMGCLLPVSISVAVVPSMLLRVSRRQLML